MRGSSDSGRGFVLADVVGGVLIILVGAFFAIYSLQYGVLGEAGRLEPGAMPVFSGLALALCGVGVVVSAFRTGTVSAAEDAVDTVPGGASQPDGSSGTETEADAEADVDVEVEFEASAEPEARVGRALVVLAAATVATYLASRIGFLAAFGLMIIGLLVGVERERVWKALAVAAGAMVFTYLLFVQFLRIPVPEGPLPFL
jgi:putative tricarboxylic transport membrane protein